MPDDTSDRAVQRHVYLLRKLTRTHRVKYLGAIERTLGAEFAASVKQAYAADFAARKAAKEATR